MNIQLTPLVEPLQRRAFEGFSRLLNLDAVDWEDRSLHEQGSSWALLVRLASGLALELAPPRAGRSYAQGPAIALSYRKLPDGQDPMRSEPHRAELARVVRKVEKISTAELSPALEALARWRRFYETTDDMFVQQDERSAVLRLGFRCNQDCGFCWQGRRWPDTPSDLVFTWIDEILGTGIHRITFSGGEPTLYRDLPRVIAHARDSGATVNVQTNAIRMSKPAYVEELLRAGLSEAFVSYHCSDPAISDAMTRAPKTHDRTVQGIENMLRAGLRVRLNCVVEKRNYKLLRQHAEKIVERFVQPFEDNPIYWVEYSHPCSSYDPSIYEEMLVPLDLVKPHLLQAISTLRSAGVTAKAIGTCGFPPCLLADDPELLERIDPTKQHAMNVFGREHVDACGECDMRSGCLGVRREYVAQFAGRGLVPLVSPAERE